MSGSPRSRRTIAFRTKLLSSTRSTVVDIWPPQVLAASVTPPSVMSQNVLKTIILSFLSVKCRDSQVTGFQEAEAHGVIQPRVYCPCAGGSLNYRHARRDKFK